jgi:hypothetical protein
MTRRRLSFFVLALGLTASLGIGIAPAQAAPSLGSGLVRIDAGWATIQKLPSGKRVLTLDKNASGQWLGEIGRSRTLAIREIDDRNLVQAWDALGHGSGVGVASALTWNSGKDHKFVRLADPVLTPSGQLRFVLKQSKNLSTSKLPTRLKKVGVNITRAPLRQNRSFPIVNTFHFTSSVALTTTVPSAAEASIVFSSDKSECFSSTLTTAAPDYIPVGNCGPDLTFNGYDVTLTPATIEQDGDVYFKIVTTVTTTTTNTANQPWTFTVKMQDFNYSGYAASWTYTGKS